MHGQELLPILDGEDIIDDMMMSSVEAADALDMFPPMTDEDVENLYDQFADLSASLRN